MAPEVGSNRSQLLTDALLNVPYKRAKKGKIPDCPNLNKEANEHRNELERAVKS